MKLDKEYIKCEYTELVSIDKIKPDEKNPNIHNDEQINKLAGILMYQGIRKPLIVSKLNGLLVTGHGTLEAIKRNGWQLVPVSYQDFENYDQQYAHLIADNAIARQAELDFSMINFELENLGPDLNVDMLGIKDFNLDNDYSDFKEPDKKKDPELKLPDVLSCPNCGTVIANG
jgi:hypothetical protein